MDIKKLLGFKDYIKEEILWVTIYEDKINNRVFSTMCEAINSDNKSKEIKSIKKIELDKYVNPIVAQKWKT